MRLLLIFLLGATTLSAQVPNTGFSGEKTSWHEGFDRYDFLMDEQTFAITPIVATPEEKYGAKAAEKGEGAAV